MQILMLLPTDDRTLELLECEGHFVCGPTIEL